ncbi:MAG: T9SS type A sorting domain-containing protein [Bacteroidota bacterium]
MRYCLTLLLLLGLVGSAAAQDRTRYLGLNLAEVTDFSPELVFVDAMRAARPWISHSATDFTWDTGQPINVDASGWPTRLEPDQHLGTILMTSPDAPYPTGVYTILYEGQGTIEVEWDAVVSHRSPGQIFATVDEANIGIHLIVTELDESDPIRNIRVIIPGFEQMTLTPTFHPSFLEYLAPFSLLRFRAWSRINNSPVVDWADRATPQHQTYFTDRGVALEHQIELANTLQADAWFNIPHQATEDYVAQFATMVRDNLDPDLTAYIEYSHEVWNTFYAQAEYARASGDLLNLSTDATEARLRYYSERSVEVFAIWEDVFGGTDRFVRVLGGLNQTPGVAEEIIQWNNAFESADAYAVAPYFGGNLGSPAQEATTADFTDEALLNALSDELTRVLADNRSVAATVNLRGLDLLAYEGGQYLAGFGGVENNATITALFSRANANPLMYDLYQAYLTEWHDYGGPMALYASSGTCSPFGCWGLRPTWTTPLADAPKLQAALHFIQATSVATDDAPEQPTALRLDAPYPNPFSESVTLRYRLDAPQPVTLTVYDLLGRPVATLADGVQPAGPQTATWIASDDLAAGLYLVRLEADDHSDTRRLSLVR